MSLIVNSFFTLNGNPATGLSPLIRIWEITPSTDALIINNDSMVEIGDGFYKYEFVSFNPLKNYLIRTDGGISLSVDRYQTESYGEVGEIANIIANEVWEEDALSHTNIDTTGLFLNQLKAGVTQIQNDMAITVIPVLTLLEKINTNKSIIDKDNQKMIIYDDDGITPLLEFYLKDSNGAPSVVEVCQRIPV